jgi:hypothetical protein
LLYYKDTGFQKGLKENEDKEDILWQEKRRTKPKRKRRKQSLLQLYAETVEHMQDNLIILIRKIISKK